MMGEIQFVQLDNYFSATLFVSILGRALPTVFWTVGY